MFRLNSINIDIILFYIIDIYRLGNIFVDGVPIYLDKLV